MHGSSLLVNALLDTMGDVVDCRKTSSRLAAIEKAQTELRQEFDAREKRKRELEFLEKGGNPLDFKFGRSDFVGGQSTSGAKLASSPRGDSVESSVKEANIADNLLLFIRERNAKRVANLEGSLTLRHGVKSQAAYARRNRSRKGRDCYSNKPSVPSLPELLEARPEEHAVSSVSNSKPVSPKVASDSHQDMEIDGGKAHDASTEMIKDVVQEGERKVIDLATNIDANTEQVANCANSISSDLVGKGEASIHQEASGSSERNKDVTTPDKDMNDENGSNTRRETNKVHSDKIDDIVGVADDDKLATVKRVDSNSNEDPKELPFFRGASENNDVGEKSQFIGVDAPITHTGEFESSPSYLNKSVVKIKHEVELSDMSNEISHLSKNECMKANGEIVAKSERKPSNSLGDSSHSINKAGAVTSTLVLPSCEPSSTSLCKRGATTTTAVQHYYATSNEKLVKKVGEDAILKQAQTIEANLKRAVDLPMRYISLEKRMKCHWDFVLEEMAWMAKDFMQERLWKTTVAGHICHQVASTSQRKSEQKIACQKQRNIVRTLAISVMNFWHSADRARTNIEASSGMNGECTSDILKSCKVNGSENERDQDSKYMEAKNRCLHPAIQAYAVRFLKYDNGTFDHPVLVEAPSTPDRIHDTGVVGMSWEDQLSEESFFYTLAPGSMQAYREAVESQWVNHKKMSNSVLPEDCDASICDPLPDGTREYAYEEEEEEDDETSSYYLPGAFEVSSSSKFTMKKRKNSQQKSYDARICDGSSNWSYDPCLESTFANQGMIFVGKRPSNSLNVCSVPTKRVRTAARQRVTSPFSAGVSGSLQVTSKTDVSSEDTNCFQDDQISKHGGSRKNMEVESTVDFEKHLPSDGNELSPKSSKKKKPKHGDYRMSITDSGVLIVSGKGSLLDQRLQADSMVQHKQRDHAKKDRRVSAVNLMETLVYMVNMLPRSLSS